MFARLALTPLLGAVQVPAPPDLALEWVAPPECPDRPAVLAAIARRLGRELTPDEAVVEARVARFGARGFKLRLRLAVGARGETREVVDPSCAALADAVALLVATAVEPADPAAVPLPPDSAPAPPPARAEDVPESRSEGTGDSADRAAASEDAPLNMLDQADDPSPDVPARRPDQTGDPAPAGDALAVPPPRSRRPGGSVRLHAGAELGAVPGVTGAVGVAGGLLWRRWRLELQGLFLAPRSRPLAQVDVRVGLLAGAVHGCARPGRGAIEVPLCLGLEAGAMRGEARNWPSGRPAFQGWLAGVIGAGVAWHAGARWGLWAAAQLVLAPVRPRFELGENDQALPLWKPGLASGRLLLGVELRFGDPW